MTGRTDMARVLLPCLAAGGLLLGCRREPATPSGSRMFPTGGELTRARIRFETRDALAAGSGTPFVGRSGVARGSLLDFAIGLQCPGQPPCAGAWNFTIEARSGAGRLRIFERTIDAGVAREWEPVQLPLDPVAGHTVELAFGASRARPGPARPFWGAPRVLRPSPSPVTNVVLISVDTLRSDRLGCYGYHRPTSPRIDRLAAEGVRFDQAISQAPWTTPSHASLLTSLYPSSHQLTQGWASLSDFQKRGRGYRILPEDVLTLAEALQQQGYRTLALTGGGTLAGELGFAQGFEVYREDATGLEERVRPMLSRWLVDNRKLPFFIFFHTFEVHAPYRHPEMAEHLLTAAQSDTIRERSPRDSPSFESLLREMGLLRRDVTSALYDGGILFTDTFLGWLFDNLRRLDLEERTLVVFTSDHGEEFGDHDPARFYDAHCRTVFDELIRVPLILRLPGAVPAGRVVSAPVELVDVAPTILDYLGIQPPLAMSGRSLRRLAAGRGGTHKEWTLSEATCMGPEMKALRGRELKYVASYEARGDDHAGLPGPRLTEGIFDLSKDPGETRNLSAPRRLVRMQGILEERARALARGSVRGPEAHVSDDVMERLRGLGYVR